MTKVITIEEAVSNIKDGTTLMFGGFGGIGNPPTLIKEILKSNIKNLSLIGNDAGFPQIGIGQLITAGRVKKLTASHIGSNPNAGKLMQSGDLEVEFSPQGTLVERMRAGGVGLSGVLLDVGLGTLVAEGKEKIMVDGKQCILELPLKAEVSILYAKKADTYGNLVFEKSARNTNPLVAMAGEITIVEVEEIVELGEIDPEEIIVPGVFVDYIVKSEGVDWKWAWENQ